MIAKNIKGKSFKGCVSYVMHEGATLLEAEGVWANNTKDMIRSFAMQRSGRKEIKQPVGHIPISFSPDDKGRMTDEFMLKLAKEYMEGMGIRNTQYIIVRHHNTEHPHLHIVYNRIDNDLKLISVNHDYKRNIKICKQLKDKYNLTYGKGKENVNVQKLKGAEQTKYEIYHAIKSILPKVKDWQQFEQILNKEEISIEYKHKGQTDEVQGISFKKGDHSFKGSEVDRKFSYSKLDAVLNGNYPIQEQQVAVPKETGNKLSENSASRVADIASGTSSLLKVESSGNDPYKAEKQQPQPQRRIIKKNKRRGFSL